jgi:hypothetical protein
MPDSLISSALVSKDTPGSDVIDMFDSGVA